MEPRYLRVSSGLEVRGCPGLGLRCGPLNLLGFRALLASDNVENDLVTLPKGLETVSEYSGVMHEDILSRLLGNKTQAFLIVPPFNFAFSHSYLLKCLQLTRAPHRAHARFGIWVLQIRALSCARVED